MQLRVDSPTPAAVNMSHMCQDLRWADQRSRVVRRYRKLLLLFRRESLFSVMSGLYAIMVVVVGVALPLASLVLVQDAHFVATPFEVTTALESGTS